MYMLGKLEKQLKNHINFSGNIETSNSINVFMWAMHFMCMFH